jgi:hypothetical protein
VSDDILSYFAKIYLSCSSFTVGGVHSARVRVIKNGYDIITILRFGQIYTFVRTKLALEQGLKGGRQKRTIGQRILM